MIIWINPTSQFHQINPNWTKSPIWVVSSPRNSKFTQFNKLIKLIHIEQLYIIPQQKPIDQLWRKGLNHQNPQIFIGSKLSPKCMEKCMELENKWKRKGIKVLPALKDKNLAKDSEENDKNLLWPLDRSKRERIVFEKFWKSDEHVKLEVFKKTLYAIFDWSKLRFDRSKIPSIDPIAIKHRSKHTEPNQNFNHNFDQSRNRFDQLKL